MRREPRRPVPNSRTSRNYRNSSTITRHNEVTAGRVALDGIRAYGRWVKASPDTRGLANTLVALYPVGGVMDAANAPWYYVGPLAVPLGAAVGVGALKASRSRQYTAIVTATAAGVPVWLATAGQIGIWHWHTLLGYTTAASASWVSFTWSDVLRKRRAWKREQVRWETIAATAGLEDSRLVRIEETRLGQRFRIDIRGTGKTARQLARGDLDERVAAVLGLPAERVRVTRDDKHAGIVLVLVQTVDPWAEPVTHPALTSGIPAQRGRARSVMDGPFVLGDVPDTGEALGLTVFDKAGGRHTIVVAATGGGKTTLWNSVVDQATERSDVLVWAIDLGKGTVPAIWGSALDAAAGIDEHEKALRILQWAVTVIKERSRQSGGRNHKPSVKAPVVLILVDEMDTLIGLTSRISHKAKPLVEDIFRRGRSAGVLLAMAGQRGTIQHTGSKDPHANAGNKIVLRVNRPAEMNNVIPDWEAAGMPNMANYAQGIKGVALVVDAENTWHAGRVRDMSDLDAVEAHAGRRGSPTATLEPEIAAQLSGYTDRHQQLAAVTAGDGGGAPALPAQPAAGLDVDPRDNQAIQRMTDRLVDEIEAIGRRMPKPPADPTGLADLVARKNALDGPDDPEYNQAVEVPEGIAGPILALLADRGEAGASPAELVKATGRGESTIRRWLSIMRDQGLVTTHGSTRQTRYFLPDHAPDQNDAAPGDSHEE
jgi:hypothetical protein